ncbi:hypothetical protein J6590_062909 [Homalodisca vitripennis]|nr:hypothetical protein J6590_062909 [Homalodisca vitripennis]
MGTTLTKLEQMFEARLLSFLSGDPPTNHQLPVKSCTINQQPVTTTAVSRLAIRHKQAGDVTRRYNSYTWARSCQ